MHTPTQKAAPVVVNRAQVEACIRLATLLALDASPDALALALYDVTLAVADRMPVVGALFAAAVEADLLRTPTARS